MSFAEGPDIESGPSAISEDTPASRRRRRPFWLELLQMAVIGLILAIALKTFFVAAFWIPSSSMEPGLQIQDRILVEKVSYWRGEPERGDIVVFQDPNHWLPQGLDDTSSNAFTDVLTAVGLYPEGQHLVKRVIGVEGDVIECCDETGRLMVNGVAINEQAYLMNPEDCAGPMPPGECSWTAGPVPEGHLFVMGDNRGQSADSSAHMCQSLETDCVPGREFVPVDLVVGRAFVLVWPASHFTWLKRPDSFEDVPDGEGS